MTCIFTEAELRQLTTQSPFSFTELEQAALVLGQDSPGLTLLQFTAFLAECAASGLSPYSTALLRACPQ